jgi:hypothetical protein
LSAGEPYAVLSCTPGNAKPIFRTVSKLIVLLGMGECDYPQEQEPLQDGCWGKSSVEECGGVSAESGIPTFQGVGEQTAHACENAWLRQFALLLFVVAC